MRDEISIENRQNDYFLSKRGFQPDSGRRRLSVWYDRRVQTRTNRIASGPTCVRPTRARRVDFSCRRVVSGAGRLRGDWRRRRARTRKGRGRNNITVRARREKGYNTQCVP